jgi:hypothetical protein
VSCHEALPCDELCCIGKSLKRRLIKVSPKNIWSNCNMNTTTREGFLMNTSRRIPRIMVKALAAGAVLVAAALPLAMVTEAGAATISSVTFVVSLGNGLTATASPSNTIGSGATGTFTIAGTGFAGDGSNTTVTTTAPGLTFSGVAEANGTTPDSGTSVTGSFASTTATTPGDYTITVTDDTGPSTSATTATGVIVVAAPTITAVTPATPLTQSAPPVASVVTITGTGFVANATVTFTNTTDGTVLTSGIAGNTFAAGKDTTTVATGTGQGSATEGGAGTTLTATVYPTNSITGGTEAAGTYDVTVENPNGGTATDAGSLTLIPYGITNLSPSALPFATTAANTSVTISGAGFEPGALVTLSCTAGTESVASSSVVSATQITAVISVTDTATAALCSVTVANPAVSAGGNAASFTLAGALGIGEASTVAPTITATSATAATALVAGAPATTVTLTGTGLSQYSSALAFVGTGTTTQTNVILSDPQGNTGTAVTFNVSDAGTGSVAGPYNVVVKNTTAASNAFPAAVLVAGPVITSQTPVGLAVGAPVGTTITLTGTGFTSTTNGVVVSAGGSLAGIVSYVNATTENLVLTAAPNATDLATPPSVELTQVPSAGTSVLSPLFKLKIDAAPTVSGLTYTVGTDVGVGAVAQQVVIHGSGFQTGATVTKFVNGNSVADADVTATVTSINTAGTAITATIAIAAGDTNIADGYTVTNPDGGTISVPATLTSLVIGAGPTITSVSPATGTPSGTTAFTITGTGFQTGATVAASSDGTCGSATVVSATSVTVSCTLGAATATPVTLAVTNADGGSAVSAPVLVASAPVVSFHVSKVNGSAVAGKTVTITISGTGFSGQPKIKSSLAGVKAVVSHDSGKLLTVRITTPKTGKGEHTLTVTLASGKSGKVNYSTKA